MSILSVETMELEFLNTSFVNVLDITSKECTVASKFPDSIYGFINVHPACLMIIDTLQFQRLRHIKQLGMVEFVYTGATHNRFEHSLGVCHLSGRLVKQLQKSQPYLQITDVDILCIEIAGLCINLGQGPFSDVFLERFLPSMEPNIQYKHPSAAMFQHLLAENNLEVKLKIYGIESNDIQFIKELLESPTTSDSLHWPYRGRCQEKAFLYQIVENSYNGMDVKKWDQLSRDCHHLGKKHNFNIMRFIESARVIQVNGKQHICFQDKEINNIFELAYTLYNLRKDAFCHKVTCAVQLMLVRAFEKANSHIKFKGYEKECELYECYTDMKALTKLTDTVLYTIYRQELEKEQPEDPVQKEYWKDLTEAKDIITRILNTDLYVCVYETQPMLPEDFQACFENHIEASEQALLQEIQDKITKKEFIIKCLEESTNRKVSQDDFVRKVNELIAEFTKNNAVIIQKVNDDFGMRAILPWKKMLVYSKQEPTKARQIEREETSRNLECIYSNQFHIRVFSTDRDSDKCQIITKAANEILKV